MLIVVADASPIRYLVEIEQAEILPKLFDRILVPSLVISELTSSKTPSIVRAWIQELPHWIEVKTPKGGSLRGAVALDEGEEAALLLASESGAGAVLIDDRAGATAAKALGFTVIPTLRILQWAAQTGLLDLRDAFERLRSTNFRYRRDLMDQLLSELDG
jgi:predicted nucleic acid-binding protein